MSYTRFYTVSEKSSIYYSNAKIISKKRETHICENCKSISLLNPNSPFRFIIEGKRLADIMKVYPGYYLVSEKTYHVFTNNNITGITFNSNIECDSWYYNNSKLENTVLPKYYYMEITSICGYSLLSNGICIPRCPICGSVNNNYNLRGVKTAFDNSKWDGRDVFTHSNSTIMICTEKVKNLVLKNKLSNFEFLSYRCVNYNNHD